MTIRFGATLAALTLLPLIGWALRPAPSPATARPPAGFTAVPAVNASQKARHLVDAIIQIESNGDPRRVGSKGERGLMQIRAGTWRDMTKRLFGRPLPFDRAFEPALNRRVGTAYLAFLQERILPRQSEWKTDERTLLLAAYNAGPGRLRKSGYDLARMPRQTRDYVARATALHDVYLSDLAASARQDSAPRSISATGI